MEMRHSHLEKRRLFEDSEPMVKRKLFCFSKDSNCLEARPKEDKDPASNPMLTVKEECLTKSERNKSSFLIDDDDLEITFKNSNMIEKIEPKNKSAFDIDPNAPLNIEMGLFQKACLASPERIQLDFVPEKHSVEQSPSFKRSLSVCNSDDNL